MSEETPPDASNRRGLRRSLSDPLVLAAFVGVIGAIAGTLITSARPSAIDRDYARCDRAFAFLQDEAVNPRMREDLGFYQMQREIAVRCSRSAD